MRRFRVPEIVFGFMAATSLWVTVAVIYPKYDGGEQQTAQNATPKSLEETEAETNRRIADYNEALDWLTAFVVLANLGLWIVTWRSGVRQSRDMRVQVLETRRIGEAQARAYVHISEACIDFFFDQGIPFVTFVVANSGQSPARNFVWDLDLRYGGGGPIADGSNILKGERWLTEPGFDIPATTKITPEPAGVNTMSIRRIIAGRGISGTTPRLEVKYRYLDVFGREWFGSTHFSGFTDIPKAVWEDREGSLDALRPVKLNQIPRPADWGGAQHD